MFKDGLLRGRRILVTGGGTGLGKGMAEKFLALGAEICARAAIEAFDYLDAPPAKVSVEDVPMPYAANLEKLALPSVAEVVEAAKAVCYR